MNKTKRGLELAAVITAIVLSALMLISAIYSIVDLFVYTYYGTLLEMVIFYTVLLILIQIAILVLSGLLCANPIKNNKIRKRTGLLISLVSLEGLMTLIIFIAVFTSAWMLILLAIQLAILGLLIASMVLKHKDEFKPESITKPSEKQISQNVSVATIQDKIEYIKKLKAENSISEEVYNNLIIKYLEQL